MPALTYQELTAELFPRLTGGIRWGLDRTRRLLAGVGDPHLRYRVLHVGGTNGKGSIAAHLESVLRHAGHRTGLYTSPHLCSFRERIRVDGRAISEHALLDAATRLWPAITEERPSFFEATTAIAFLAMADAGVDFAVVEVGLGGRLDSTNVVEPDVVILSNVSLDHVQLLGPTREHVAREKAGIIKHGVPVITGEHGTPAAAIFETAARERGAPLRTLQSGDVRDVVVGRGGTSFTLRGTPWGEQRLHTSLIGEHQAGNAALAVMALAALRESAPPLPAVVQGLAATEWPGRLQILEVAGATWVFDVAHNVAGAESLAGAVRRLDLPRPLVAVVGVLGDKDWEGMLGPLCDVADEVILTMPPTAPPERRWDPHAVLDGVACVGARVVEDFTAALQRAWQSAHASAGTILVTGSFHTVGDALAALGMAPDGADVLVAPPAFLRTPR